MNIFDIANTIASILAWAAIAASAIFGWVLIISGFTTTITTSLDRRAKKDAQDRLDAANARLAALTKKVEEMEARINTTNDLITR